MDALINSASQGTLSLPQAAEFLLRKIDSLREEPSPLFDSPQVFRIEVGVEFWNILRWLAAQESETRVFWANREGGFQTAGVGIADRILLPHPAYDELFQYLRRRLSPRQKNVRYFGGIGFDPENTDCDWDDFGCCQFWLPRFELVHSGEKTLLACNLVFSKRNKDRVIAQVRQELQALNGTISLNPPPALSLKQRQDWPEVQAWVQGVQEAFSLFERGPLEKLVLARRSDLWVEPAISSLFFLSEIQKAADNCFYFYFQPREGTGFLGASPERLYCRRGRRLKTEAVAGTRARTKDPQENERLKRFLLESEKDLKEHRYVVEFLEKGLRKCCSTNRTAPLSVLELNEGMHLFTGLEGLLKEETSEADLLRTFHPTPAVAGFPLQEAQEAILRLEPFRRGWYAGAVGWVGFDATEFAVAIRSALIRKDRISLYAGAGIVQGSHPKAEWDEVENKMNTFLKILQG